MNEILPGAPSTECEKDSGTITLSPGLTTTAKVQTVKIKGRLTGCVGNPPTPFAEASYTATLKTSEPVACSALKTSGQSASGAAKFTWTPKAKASTGMLEMLLTETGESAFSVDVTAGTYAPLLLSGKVEESFTGGPTCGSRKGKSSQRL